MSASALGPEERREIQRFTMALTLESGFAFHVVVADTRRVLEEALDEVWAKTGLAPVVLGRPPHPELQHHDDLEPQIQHLLGEIGAAIEGSGERPVVVDAVLPRSMEPVWGEVFGRLNEFRNSIEAGSSSPLVLCVTPSLETALGQGAPDIWSKRGSGMRLSDRTPVRVFVSRAPDDEPGVDAAIAELMADLTAAGFDVCEDIHRSDLIVAVCTRSYRDWIEGDSEGARTTRDEVLGLRVPATRVQLVLLDDHPAPIPTWFEEHVPTTCWPSERPRLIERLRRPAARRLIHQALSFAFADDRRELDEWEDGHLTGSTTDEADPDRRALRITDRILRMQEPEDQLHILRGLSSRLLEEDDDLLQRACDRLGLTLGPRQDRLFRMVSAPPSGDLQLVPFPLAVPYLDDLVSRHRLMGLLGLGATVETRTTLDELQIPLDGSRGLLSRLSLASAFGRARTEGKRGIVLLGDQGTGKTTHLSRLILQITTHGPESVGLPLGTLPVFVSARDLVSRSTDLAGLVEEQLAASSSSTAMPDDAGQSILEHGRVVLLVDGLDEVAEPARPTVARWLERARRTSAHVFTIVTCRRADYTPLLRLDSSFLELHLRPLLDLQVRRIVHRWFAAAEATDPDDLLATLSSPELAASTEVDELIRNPLLLQAVCAVFRARGRVPRTRTELDSEYAAVLAERRARPGGESAPAGTIVRLPRRRYPRPRASPAIAAEPGRRSKSHAPAARLVAPRGGVELVRVPSEPFAIAITPVTNAQYAEFLRARPTATTPAYWGDRERNRPSQPVVGISWHDAMRYCEWAGLDLPTEDQWGRGRDLVQGNDTLAQWCLDEADQESDSHDRVLRSGGAPGRSRHVFAPHLRYPFFGLRPVMHLS